MFKSSALLASVAFAADSVDNYTGTLPDLAGGAQGDLTNVKVEVKVEQKGSQVTYDWTVSGLFSEDDSAGSRETNVGFCYPTSEDKNDCILFQNYGHWYDDGTTTYDSVTNQVMRAIDVVDVNAVKTNWIGQLIGFTDSRCGEYDVVKSFAEPLPTFIYQPYEKDDKPICKTLSMDAAKQGYADKAFTMQAKVTDAASTDETAALALLTAFKTASTTMRGGYQDRNAGSTNAAFALTFTEVADSPTDAEGTDSTADEGTDSTADEGTDSTADEGTDSTADEGTDSTDAEGTDSTADEGTDSTADEGTDSTADEGTDSTDAVVSAPPTDDGASAMTTFAVAIVAVAALF